MNWKEMLTKFEQAKDWQSAIALMQKVINEDGSLDAYLSMNYLLMNLLVEEQYDLNDRDYYAELLMKYYTESYAKFSNNPEYLFYIGEIACISEWYCDLEREEALGLMKKASELEPDNILYQSAYYEAMHIDTQAKRDEVTLYARKALSDPEVNRELKSKGSLGEYILMGLEYWSKGGML